MNRSLTCGLDPVCRQARDGIRQVYEGERDQLLPGLRQAAVGGPADRGRHRRADATAWPSSRPASTGPSAAPRR